MSQLKKQPHRYLRDARRLLCYVICQLYIFREVKNVHLWNGWSLFLPAAFADLERAFHFETLVVFVFSVGRV